MGAALGAAASIGVAVGARPLLGDGCVVGAGGAVDDDEPRRVTENAPECLATAARSQHVADVERRGKVQMKPSCLATSCPRISAKSTVYSQRR